MAVMLSKLYAALKAAGAPEDIAREAAEEGASFDERMQRVEVKLHEDDLDQAEQQLKRYMFGMRCPLGLLVTPERMRLLRRENIVNVLIRCSRHTGRIETRQPIGPRGCD